MIRVTRIPVFGVFDQVLPLSAIQSQELVSGLKFRINEVEKLCFLSSEISVDIRIYLPEKVILTEEAPQKLYIPRPCSLGKLRDAQYWCHFHILEALHEFCVHYTDKRQTKQQVLYTTVNIELCALIQVAFHPNVISDRRPKN